MIPNEDQKALQAAARRFARERLLPGYQARDAAERLDRQLLKEMGGLGLLGIDLPERLGGLGAAGVTAGMIIEELAYGDYSIGSVTIGVSLLGAILVRNAPAEIVDDWVPRMIKGEVTVSVCVTEPGAGSDAGNLQLRARRDGDDYVLNGEKTSISNAHDADAFLVFARTGKPESGARGVTALFMSADTPGIRRTRFDDIGSRQIPRGSVFFDDVRVPARGRLGAEGAGFTQVMAGFDYSRALIALQCVGTAQASLDEAWAYTKERAAFNRPIAQFQGVSFPLVEGESMLAAVRQLSLHALALRDAGQPHTAEAAMVKWLGPKTAFDLIHQCLLTFGHYGYTMETPHQQRLRDVMGHEIGDGTAGVMKLIVARERAGRASVQ